MNTPVVYKQNEVKQRTDVGLTKEIVIALTKLILEGKTIYPKEGFVHTHAADGRVVNVSKNTIQSWVSRGNVLPDTGETLRDILDKARVKRKEIESALMKQEILDKARRGLNDVLALPDNLGAKNISTHYYRNKEGNIVQGSKTIFDRGVNTEIIGIKAKTAQFALERLDPDFARKDKVEGKHLIFSLSDLRRATKEQNADGN